MIQPFLTYYRENPDYNPEDARLEFESMVFRNNAIEDYLEGNQHQDYLFDVLASQGIDPDQYVESVDAEIDYFTANPHLLYC